MQNGTIFLALFLLVSMVSPSLVSVSETPLSSFEENLLVYPEDIPLELRFLAGEVLTFGELRELLGYENLPPEMSPPLFTHLKVIE